MRYILFLFLLVFLSCTNSSNKTQEEKDSAAKAYDSAGKEIIRKTP